MVIAKKAQQTQTKMANNGSPVEVVSKVILEAVTSKNPNLRYLAGKDVETWAANKKTMSDKILETIAKIRIYQSTCC
jgi:hypothetical protein